MIVIWRGVVFSFSSEALSSAEAEFYDGRVVSSTKDAGCGTTRKKQTATPPCPIRQDDTDRGRTEHRRSPPCFTARQEKKLPLVLSHRNPPHICRKRAELTAKAASITELHSRIKRAGHAWTINITRITIKAQIEITLIGVEDILYAYVQLKDGMLIKLEIIGSLTAHFHEIGSAFCPVLSNVARIVLHQHRARIGPGQ